MGTYDHREEQLDAIYLVTEKTGWTGVDYTNSNWTDALGQYHIAQNQMIKATVCNVMGHHMVTDEHGWSYCNYCGDCADPECCPQ